MASKLFDNLVEFIATQMLKNLTVKDLDAGYAALTDEEKLLILRSLLGEDNNAKTLVKTKLYQPLKEAAKVQAQSYIDAGSIPLNIVKKLFQG